MERVLKEGRGSQPSDSFSLQIGRDPTFLKESSCDFDRARMRSKDLIYLHEILSLQARSEVAAVVICAKMRRAESGH